MRPRRGTTCRHYASEALAWVAVAAAHAAASWVVSRLPTPGLHLLDWERASALQPWRIFSAAWVHWSPQHLAMNLAGAAVIALLGWAMRLPRAAALAWLLAWPMGQVAVALLPTPTHLGGLSGTLHAGAAVAAVWLLRTRVGATRSLGAVMLAAITLKLAWEWWRGPQPIVGSLAVSWPAVHLAGSLCGMALGALLARRPPRRP